MNLEKQQRAAKILQRVIELPPEERDRMLESLCDGDTELISWCREILEHDSISADLTADPSDTPDTETQSELEGEEIGAYRLGENIGSGGMGTVYRSRRIDREFDQEVAIKVLHRNIDARHLKSEQQILAQLDHPNIARLIDAGTTEQDRSYVVMEYIKGAPITDYAERNQLTIKQRLLLFISLCDAVSFAHKNLIVHRDLKPANILVDEDGNVKLLDFGIAKLLPSDQALTTYLHTQTANRRLTPAYASPEQITGKLISTSSDVYSLGVILYELLTGKRPFEDLESDAREHEQAILDTDPQAPSRRLSSSVSAQGLAKTDLIPRKIRGDLDNIVLKALSTDPEDRYVSAQEFSNDVLAYLLGKPVNARRVGALTKGWKFIKRHKIATLITVGILSGLSYQQFRIVHERNTAISERQAAIETKNFMIDLFRNSDLDSFAETKPTVEELLIRGSENLKSELEDRPLVKAEISRVIANALIHSGSDQLAADLLDDAEKTYLEDPERHVQQLAIIELNRSELYIQLGEYQKSVSAAQKAIDLGISQEPSVEHDLGYANATLSIAYRQAHQYQEALEAAKTALEFEGSLNGEHTEKYLQYRLIEGRVYTDFEQYETARDIFLAAHELFDNFKGLGRKHYLNANDIAACETKLNNYEQAELWYQIALDKIEEYHDGPHPDTVTVLTNYGAMLNEQQKVDQAAETLKRALDTATAVYPPDNQLFAYINNNLATSYLQQKRYKLSEKHYTASRDQFVTLFGEQSTPNATLLNNIGRVHRALGNISMAEASFISSIQVREGLFGVDHSSLVLPLISLGELYLFTDRLDESRDALLRSKDIAADSLEENNKKLMHLRHALIHLDIITHRDDFDIERLEVLEQQLRAHFQMSEWRMDSIRLYKHILGINTLNHGEIQSLLSSILEAEELDNGYGTNLTIYFDSQS